MAQQSDDIERLLSLRKLTRSVADTLREKMKGYLTTLSPLLRPRLVLGDNVQGSTSEAAKNPDAAFKELLALHDRLIGAKPFTLRTQLATPLRLASTTLEISPMEYVYLTTHGEEDRQVVVRSPLKWIVSYTGYSPARLKELLLDRQRSAEELHEYLVSYLVLHVVVSRQAGVTELLKALHFPVTSERIEEFGDLPITCISCSISTQRPSDDIIFRSAELSGMNAFEEVLRYEDVQMLREPLKDELTELVKSHGIRI